MPLMFYLHGCTAVDNLGTEIVWGFGKFLLWNLRS
jgi:hypothetical protein